MSKLAEFFFRPPERSLTPAQRWGLIAGGLLTHVNDGGYDSLWFPFGRTKAKAYLRDGWSTESREDLDRIHNSLARTGHRAECAAVCDYVRAIQQGYVPYDPNDPSIGLYRWVSDHLVVLEHSRLIAWDYTRLVNVARWGYTAGMINQTTAWQWILEAAHVLQRSYRSWPEIGEDFLLGFSFWRGGEPPEDMFIAAHEWLSKSPQSPWSTTPWDFPLE